jgi:hypothetical protein
MTLLKDCIKEIVFEAVARKPVEHIRDQFGDKKNVFTHRPTFKLNDFKKISDLDETQAYAKRTLQQLGEGSSRIAYRLTGSRVLKIAHDPMKGTAQNEAELDTFTNPLTKPIVARIFDYDKNYKWIVSEVVRPFSNSSQFENKTGIPWWVFQRTVFSVIRKEKNVQDETFLSKVHAFKLSEKQAEFIKSAIELIHLDVLPGDVLVVEHWGVTSDGRVVILDYGFTSKVSRVYGSDDEANSEQNTK